MRVLVTGASGHVGGAIAIALERDGHEVVGLARHPGPVPGVYGRLDGNLADPAASRRIADQVARCDAVVHAAASLAHDPHDSSVALVNCLGTQQVVALAERWDVRSLVYVSSVPVIGRPVELPVTEDHPVDPPTAYHASKLFGERLVALAARRGLAAVSLRLTSPVGPGMPAGRILSAFVAAALEGAPLRVAGRGTRRQDYVDVRDVATATATALERRVTGTLNIAAGVSVSNRELADRVVAALGSRSAVETAGGSDPEDDVAWEVSIARATQGLGYAPARSLEDSVRAVAGADG